MNSNGRGSFLLVCLVLFLSGLVLANHKWDGSATIVMRDGKIVQCSDHTLVTPAAVACFPDSNHNRNIFTIPKSDIQSLTIRN